MTPYARALAAYQSGDTAATFTITRDDGFAATIAVAEFFDTSRFDELEARALDLCAGRVLDAGAGAGRHSLELLRRGHDVVALDVEPVLGDIQRERGIAQVVTADVVTWHALRFDTVLLLMNGIGLVGSPARLDGFLANVQRLLEPGGQMLCDSIDVGVTDDPVHVAYREANVRAGRAPGQQVLRITFEGETGEPFEWLHIAPEALSRHCDAAGLRCEVVRREPSGRCLVRIGRA